jgi:hypothetical protein
VKDSSDMKEFKKFCNGRTVVIWGLRNFNHTHSYIHLNYYRVLKRNDIKVIWLDDQTSNQKHVPANAIAITVGFASKHLPLRSDITYIAHNMDDSTKNVLSSHKSVFYENFKGSSVGIKHANASLALWNPSTNTLAQPYGTPIHISQWSKYNHKSAPGGCEYWIGSIWNDSLNRGNQRIISQYIRELEKKRIKFRQVELGSLAKFPNSFKLERKLVSSSSIGASIHSDFQVSESNIVCRFFKSISFGKLPVTNQLHVSWAFPGSAIVGSDLAELIDSRLTIDRKRAETMFDLARITLTNYTYEQAFDRFAQALTDNWKQQ